MESFIHDYLPIFSLAQGVLGWICVGFLIAAYYAAKDSEKRTKRLILAAGTGFLSIYGNLLVLEYTLTQ